GRGPGSGVWPFWLSLGMALTSVWTVVRWFRKTTSESRNETPYIDPDHLPLVAVSFIGLTVMVVLVSFVGTYISIALFLGFYMRVIGKHSWGLTTATVIGMVLMVYFLFEWQLSKYLPKGLPIFEDGFLWIDNFRWTYLM
ncbi:MAG: tripartite tricarboxylate transporter TctB family protein, partial [Gammaproteobacteria bacterium]|nr:tripartite tricarboxylate transporter TctB family protein [Gammaproteobacteria bacterium]